MPNERADDLLCCGALERVGQSDLAIIVLARAREEQGLAVGESDVSDLGHGEDQSNMLARPAPSASTLRLYRSLHRYDLTGAVPIVVGVVFATAIRARPAVRPH